MSNRLPELSMLTAREREVVHLLMADSLSNKEIAKRLGLTEGTVKLHLSQVYRKLGVKNRTAVVATFVIK
jgi:two-component system nitrate/nitrite response regulator NarL